MFTALPNTPYSAASRTGSSRARSRIREKPWLSGGGGWPNTSSSVGATSIVWVNALRRVPPWLRKSG